MTQSSDLSTPVTEHSERAVARRQLEKKRKFRSDLVAYVLINAFLVGIWLFSGRGYFWPGWVLGGWGVAILLAAWEVFVRRPVTEADVERELQRLR